MVFQDPRAHVNPVRRIGDFMTETLRLKGVRARRGRGPRRAGAARRGCRRRRTTPGAVPARAVRRPAAARDDRDDAARPAAARARRRADDGARRHHAGRGHGDPRRAAPRAWPGAVVHHPRPRSRGRGCDRTAVMYAGQIVETNAADLLDHDPLHPYTAALAAARPDIAASAHRLAAIPGRPVSAFEAPSGCAFAPRCVLAQDACRAPGRRSSRSRAARCAAGARASCAAVWWRRSAASRRSPMPEPILEARGLRKEYGDLVAVDDVDLAVPEGGSLAIVGESGSGKTTSPGCSSG